jgi:hypothetical protein
MPDIKADHVVLASTKTIHWGFFDSALPPVCTIKSGETVTINSISGAPDQLPSSASFGILPEHLGIIDALKPKLGLLCVPKTLSVLMWPRNHLSWRNDRAPVFRRGGLGLTIQVEDPA